MFERFPNGNEVYNDGVVDEIFMLHQKHRSHAEITIRPILRKLSSMTEEEAVNMYNHCYPNSTAPKEVRADIIKSLLTKKGLYNEGQESFFDYIEWFPYLLSKSFDLFQLIENGFAIDQDTLKS